MKPGDVKSNTYIKSSKEVNGKNLKFKIGDNVRISKYKNVFFKSYTPSWSEEIFVIKKVKSTVSWTYVVNDLKGEEIENVLQMNCQKQIKKNLELKK